MPTSMHAHSCFEVAICPEASCPRQPARPKDSPPRVDASCRRRNPTVPKSRKDLIYMKALGPKHPCSEVLKSQGNVEDTLIRTSLESFEMWR